MTNAASAAVRASQVSGAADTCGAGAPLAGGIAQRGGDARMAGLSLSNNPLLLGFDQFGRTLDRIAKPSAESYPPYNIEQIDENGLRITLAVAGFSADDLSVQIEDNQLVIRGKQAEETDRVYLHRGIAARQFQRSFVLADGIEVTGASLDNGLLTIDLKRPPAETPVLEVGIRTAPGVDKEPKTVDRARI